MLTIRLLLPATCVVVSCFEFFDDFVSKIKNINTNIQL